MGSKRGEPSGEEEQYFLGGKWIFDGVYQKNPSSLTLGSGPQGWAGVTVIPLQLLGFLGRRVVPGTVPSPRPPVPAEAWLSVLRRGQCGQAA